MPKLKDVAFAAGVASTGMLLYGMFVESKRLVLEKRTLKLPHWPKRLNGFKIALLGDFHLRDKYSLEMAQKAVALALDQDPDMVVLIGDFVGYWKRESEQMLQDVLEPMLLMQGNVVAIPGNHEYWSGKPERLAPICESLNIKLLRNEIWEHKGVCWIGIDSLNAQQASPPEVKERQKSPSDSPSIVLWHEPDGVGLLDYQASLMLSGHSHGGQWRFPGGFTPMHTKNGRKYVRGFYPHAKIPLYVTRGVGTTGPPFRFLCPAEVSLLTLRGKR